MVETLRFGAFTGWATMRLFLPLLAVLLTAFAPLPFPKKSRPAAPPMGGRWGSEEYGQLEVTETHLKTADGNGEFLFRLVVDRAASPPTYDLLDEDGQPLVRGIYQIQGDTLTISYSRAEKGRPAAFEGKGKGPRLKVYRRVKR